MAITDTIHPLPFSFRPFVSIPFPPSQRSFSAIQLGMSNSRSAGLSASNLAEPAYKIDAKGAPAGAKTNFDSSALAKGHQAGPSAPGVTAAETASAIPAHISTGNQDLGSFGSNGTPLLSSDAQMYTKEAEKIVEEERVASEKMPNYPGLSERFQLICKMGDGAFSNVYKARYRKTGQKVAIKVVRKYELNSSQVSYSCHIINFFLSCMAGLVLFFEKQAKWQSSASLKVFDIEPMFKTQSLDLHVSIVHLIPLATSG